MTADALERTDRADAILARWCASHEAWLVPVLDEWLRPQIPWSLRDEFPVVFGGGSAARSLVLEADGELLAHAATLDATVDDGKGATRVTLVGSVVVHPEHRGRGLGRTLIEGLLRAFEDSLSELLLLWSDKPAFYAGFGFAPVGTELVTQLVPARHTARVRVATHRDLDAVLALHDEKPLRVRRSRATMRALLTVPAMTTFVLDSGNGAGLAAYACLGKGLDFACVVHEVGGSDDAARTLLHALPAEAELTVVLPPWRAALAESLGEPEHGHLGLGIVKGAWRDGLYVEGLDSI